jgi:hypothetical protein
MILTINDIIAVVRTILATSHGLPTTTALVIAAGRIMTMIGTTATAAGFGTQMSMKHATSGRGREAGRLPSAILESLRSMMIRM